MKKLHLTKQSESIRIVIRNSGQSKESRGKEKYDIVRPDPMIHKNS